MRVLITGARLPACLEIARALSSRGIAVETADTVRFGFAISSRAVQKYHRITSPAFDFDTFKSEILRIVADSKIDLVIPVSEEIFFLSQLEDSIPLFSPRFETLRALHSKFELQSFTSQTPPTKRVQSPVELKEFINQFGEVVVKKEFSRGGIGTRIRPQSLEGVSYPTLVQKYVSGTEICSYSIARNGRVQAHAAYEPSYRLGQGASVYFRSVHDESILDFVQDFVARINYTGQIAFDFIHSTEGLRVLECNPRATSGVHLLSSEQIANAFIGPMSELAIAEAGVSRAAKLTVLMTNRVSAQDFFRARDTAFQWNDPLPFLSQPASAAELIYRAWKWNMKPSDAFGFDLEWNGEPTK